ncbi:MAG: hypothetical protein M3P83_05205 [Actinomycetota bacterium]|nr:hypothetical protein [Actinomycetota bacterium]
MSSVHRRALGAAAAICGLTISGLAAPSAHSAIPADHSCPEAADPATLTEGAAVDGLTVSSGKIPDTFTGEYVGAIEDGIAPDVDMLMVRLSGSRITRTNADGEEVVDAGIWAGMSGSPVYTEDGKLLGAVSYGLSWSPSDMAGVTPAASMYALRSQPSTQTADVVAVPQEFGKEWIASGDASQAQVDGGFERLPMPTSVSGLHTRRLNALAQRADFDARSFVGGGGAATADDAKDAMIPGGNVAASLSYGDITMAGVGTVTAVCGQEVLAFGHPMLWSGRSQLTMHGAEALYIQPDTVFGSFKVANPTAPVGRIVQDRLAAILGVEGAAPATTPITSAVSAEGRSRLGETRSSVDEYLPFVAAIHTLVNIDTIFDQIGQGTGDVAWTVKLRRADGSRLTYQRSDKVASSYDASIEAAFELYEQLYRLQENRFEKVKLTSIDADVHMTPAFKALQVSQAQYLVRGSWVPVTERDALVQRAGSTLRLRVWLKPYDGSDLAGRWHRVALEIPARARDMHGSLTVRGGQSIYSSPKASNLPGLVQAMASAPRNDDVVAQLRLGRRGRPPVSLSALDTKAGVVVGGFRVAVFTF